MNARSRSYVACAGVGAAVKYSMGRDELELVGCERAVSGSGSRAPVQHPDLAIGIDLVATETRVCDIRRGAREITPPGAVAYEISVC